MGFDSGNVSFRIFHLRQGLTRDSIAQFAAMVAPPIETLSRDPIQGWVSWRHLLDREITEENCVFASWIHLALMRAERKIPGALLRAYCRIEEDIERKASQVEFLNRKARAEVKERVVAQLLPTMPPTLSGLAMVVDFRNDRVLAEALSDAQIDRFCPFFRETTGQMPLLMTAETTALMRCRVNATDLIPSTFTSDADVESEIATNLGLEFLTWLWYAWEKDGGVFHLKNRDECGYMLEGPLVFFREGKGAHEAVLRKGSPLLSREAGIALFCGKKLKRAKFTLAKGDQVWSATIDADFSIRGLKLPPGEQTDPVGRFQERMLAIEAFTEAYFELYDRFLALRRDPAEWSLCLAGLRAWVAQHAGV
jgi:hypothetical protein